MSDTDWQVAYERERKARLLAEKVLDEKTREVQNSLDVMRFSFDQLKIKNKELELLSNIASITHRSLSFDECLQLFLNSVAELVPCVYAHAYVPDCETCDDWHAFGSACQRIPMPDFAADLLNNYRGLLQGYHRVTVANGAVTISYLERQQGAYARTLMMAGILIVATIPLIRSGRCVAIAEFGFLSDEIDESHYTEVVQTAGNQISIAIERRDQQDQLATQLHELQRAHEALKGAKNQLVQSEKMASVGQLSAGIAHEINNPVGFVLSNLGSLKDYLQTLTSLANGAKQLCDNIDAQQHPALSEPAMQLQRLWRDNDVDFILSDLQLLMDESQGGLIRVRDIVAGLKDFARADQEKRELASVEDLIEQSVRLVWNEIKYTAQLQRDFQPVPPVLCNTRQISQVIVNLLANAAQALKESGTITLRLREESGCARIDVEDTGSGIEPSILNRIFEPFFTTKPVGIGTGLGLSIAYGILETHGGRIEVQSTVSVGTCFSLYLPLAQVDE